MYMNEINIEKNKMNEELNENDINMTRTIEKNILEENLDNDIINKKENISLLQSLKIKWFLKRLRYLYKKIDEGSDLLWNHENSLHRAKLRSSIKEGDNELTWKNKDTTQIGYGEITPGSLVNMFNLFQNISRLISKTGDFNFSEEKAESYNMKSNSLFLDIGSGFGKPNFHAALQVGCISYGVEVVPARVEFCKDFYWEHLSNNDFFKTCDEIFCKTIALNKDTIRDLGISIEDKPEERLLELLKAEGNYEIPYEGYINNINLIKSKDNTISGFSKEIGSIDKNINIKSDEKIENDDINNLESNITEYWNNLPENCKKNYTTKENFIKIISKCNRLKDMIKNNEFDNKLRLERKNRKINDSETIIQEYYINHNQIELSRILNVLGKSSIENINEFNRRFLKQLFIYNRFLLNKKTVVELNKYKKFNKKINDNSNEFEKENQLNLSNSFGNGNGNENENAKESNLKMKRKNDMKGVLGNLSNAYKSTVLNTLSFYEKPIKGKSISSKSTMSSVKSINKNSISNLEFYLEINSHKDIVQSNCSISTNLNLELEENKKKMLDQDILDEDIEIKDNKITLENRNFDFFEDVMFNKMLISHYIQDAFFKLNRIEPLDNFNSVKIKSIPIWLYHDLIHDNYNNKYVTQRYIENNALQNVFSKIKSNLSKKKNSKLSNNLSKDGLIDDNYHFYYNFNMNINDKIGLLVGNIEEKIVSEDFDEIDSTLKFNNSFKTTNYSIKLCEISHYLNGCLLKIVNNKIFSSRYEQDSLEYIESYSNDNLRIKHFIEIIPYLSTIHQLNSILFVSDIMVTLEIYSTYYDFKNFKTFLPVNKSKTKIKEKRSKYYAYKTDVKQYKNYRKEA